jgi:DNA-directed RNA polymerase subunit F
VGSVVNRMQTKQTCLGPRRSGAVRILLKNTGLEIEKMSNEELRIICTVLRKYAAKVMKS